MIGNMDDQRIELRAALGCENAGDRFAVGRVRAEAVDRFGWKRDEPACAESAGRASPAPLHRAARIFPLNFAEPWRFAIAAIRHSLAIQLSIRASLRPPMTYSAPVDDIVTALKTVADLDGRLANGLYPGLDAETIRAVSKKPASSPPTCLAPLNWSGDRTGSKWSDGTVTTPPGFRDAYKQFTDGGWSALPCPENYGGQGLAGDRLRLGVRNLELGQPGVRAVPAADARRDPRHRNRRQRHA